MNSDLEKKIMKIIDSEVKDLEKAIKKGSKKAGKSSKKESSYSASK